LALGFTALVAFVGSPLIKRIAPFMAQLRIQQPVYVMGVIICLGLAIVAADLGISAIIGAFLAGMALSESTEHNHDMHARTNGVTEFLVPFFLVNVGMQVQLEALTSPR